MATFTDWADVVHGPDREWGQLTCGCHPNCCIGMAVIIEKMHMTATLTKWYDEHGRHEIFAGGKAVPLPSKDHSLVLNAAAVAAGAQTDLEDRGIAKNAREEGRAGGLLDRRLFFEARSRN